MRNWHLSTIFVALATAATLHGVVACGGSDEKTSSAVPTNFDGTYRPTSAGAISAISFAHGRDYMLMAKGCETAACTEIGTYELDLAAKKLTLTDARTQSTRKISIEVLSTARRQPGSLTTKDLTEPEEQLTKGSEKLTNSGDSKSSSSGSSSGGDNKLIDLITQLLELIKSASMNGQDMKQDSSSDSASSSSSSGGDSDAGAAASCTSDLPTAESSAADIAAYFVRCPAGILTGFLGGGGAGNKTE